MDCLEAQRLISEKIDGEFVDPAEIERAKKHCRECPECGTFVRTLVALRRAPLPEPPTELADRAIAVVNARIAAETRAPKPQASSPAEGEPHSLGAAEPVSFERLKTQLLDRRNRRSIIAWVSTAAVVFVITGVVALSGVRQLATPRATPEMTFSVESQDSGTGAPNGTPTAGQSGPGGEKSGGSLSATATSPAPPYIVVSGIVYLMTGTAGNVDESAMTRVGSANTALESNLPPTSHDVLGLQDPARVYISDSGGGLLGFEIVTRTFKGRTYSLRSGDVPAFGQWPTLPSGVTRPTNPDGSPEYAEAGTDDHGVTVYRPRASSSEGIVVPPGTSGSDPAAGNPDWTWWVAQ